MSLAPWERVAGGPAGEDAWVAELRGLIADGQYFLAFDCYRAAAEAHPGSLRLALLGALSLLRGGAVEEARRLLAPLRGRLATRDIRKQRLITALRHALTEGDGPDDAFEGLVSELREAATGDLSTLDDVETLRLAVAIHSEIWTHARQPDLLDHARALAGEAFRRSGAADDGLAAALLEALAGDRARAAALAAEVADLVGAADASDAAALLVLGQARVLLGDAAGAEDAFRRANADGRRHYPAVVGVLRRLESLARAGVPVPETARAALKPPATVIFAGQPLDAADAPEPFLPPEAEGALAAEIARRLDALDAEIGYCRAHAGSDLLFIEAMLDRGAEVHVFLPFAVEDFVRHCVAYAGPKWERRFRNALKLATSVTLATEEQYFGHDVLFRLNNFLVEGMARWQAEFHLSEPHLMVAWDYMAENGAGSASDFMDTWPDITRLHLIDLEDVRATAAAAPPPRPPAAEATPAPVAHVLEPQRVIRTMLFADMVGFSKLEEADLPALWRGMEIVHRSMEGRHPPLCQLETWGDAIYGVQETAMGQLDYTFALLEGLAALDHAAVGLSRPIALRVGLHAGPVFEGTHPMTGRPLVYGSHVSRAARIEPISVPGHVYASQQFVAMLMSEDNAARHAAVSMGEPYARRFVCEYLGTLSLAKKYGRQPVYHIRRPTAAEAAAGA